MVRSITISTQALPASRVAKASSPSLDRHLAHHVRQAQLTWTATQPLLVKGVLPAATAHRWTAFRALSALTTTMRMHQQTACRAASAPSHRKAAQSAFRVPLAFTMMTWIRALLVTGMTPPALQDTTRVWVVRPESRARVASLTWTVMHLRRARHATLAHTQLLVR